MRDVVAGLDVGTTKICALLGRKDMEKIAVTSLGYSPSAGLRKGIVVDIDKASQSIKRALTEAENISGCDIGPVYVGIAGGHIKGFNGYGAIGIRDKVVKENDVVKLMDSAIAVYVPVDREILHVIPAGFRLDGRDGIIDPVGMHGDRLEASVHIVTGSVTSVQNLMQCCEDVGVDVADIVLEPLASAKSVLRDEEKQKGVVLVDIGGGTADIALYKNGVLRHTAVLAIGGNHITNDIAVGLGTTIGEAERIKKIHGCALDVVVDEELEIDITGADNHRNRVLGRCLSEIIRMRCEELMFLVRKEIEKISGLAEGVSPDLHISQVVLTGGTSLLNGIDVVAENILGFPVRVGVPEDIGGCFDVRSPVYATGVGLIQYGMETCRKHSSLQGQDALTSTGILDRMKYWAKDFLDKKNLLKGGILCLKSKM